MCKIVEELPIMSVNAVLQYDDEHIGVPLTVGHPSSFVDLPAGKEVVLIFNVRRENRYPKDLKASAPKFSKVCWTSSIL